MKNDSISLIIPMFNVESFIKECLTSIVNQTVTVDEVVLINDASTDNSFNIAKSFKEKIKNLHLIDLKINKGVSNARNLGVEKAKKNFKKPHTSYILKIIPALLALPKQN